MLHPNGQGGGGSMNQAGRRSGAGRWGSHDVCEVEGGGRERRSTDHWMPRAVRDCLMRSNRVVRCLFWFCSSSTCVCASRSCKTRNHLSSQTFTDISRVLIETFLNEFRPTLCYCVTDKNVSVKKYIIRCDLIHCAAAARSLALSLSFVIMLFVPPRNSGIC